MVKVKCYKCGKKMKKDDYYQIYINESKEGRKTDTYLLCKDCMEKAIECFEDCVE